MAPKRKATKKGSKETSFVVKTRCCPKKFSNFFNQFLSEKLGPEHKEILENWPFRNFLHLPQIGMQREYLTGVMCYWSPLLSCFVVNGKYMRFSAHDVCIILGLRGRGSPVDISHRRMVDCSVAKKFFDDNSSPEVVVMEAVLEEQLGEVPPSKPKATPKEWITILTMYLFTTVLFSMSNLGVPQQFWEYASDVDSLWDYAWGQAVFDFMQKSIPDVGSKAHSYAMKTLAANSTPTLVGCSFALLVWFYEHTKPEILHTAIDRYPRYQNWQLSTDCTKEGFMDVIAAIDPTRIEVSLTPNKLEAWVFESDTEVLPSNFIKNNS